MTRRRTPEDREDARYFWRAWQLWQTILYGEDLELGVLIDGLRDLRYPSYERQPVKFVRRSARVVAIDGIVRFPTIDCDRWFFRGSVERVQGFTIWNDGREIASVPADKRQLVGYGDRLEVDSLTLSLNLIPKMRGRP